MAEQKVMVCDGAHEAPVLASTTVEVRVDGQLRRVDLCAEHEAQLQSLLAEFLSPARGGRRGSPPRAGRPPAKRATTSRRRQDRRADLPAGQEQIRSWARDQGLEVSDRGRLSKAVIEQYRDAHQHESGE